MHRRIRTVLFSTLYPSAARPGHGIFVETRLRELVKTGEVESTVVAPVPWFPIQNPRFGSWAKMAATPRFEVRDGVPVHHPRYPLPPKVGMTVAPLLLALAARATLVRLRRGGFDFDLIDAHYYYPDGVAAALLAKWFDRPLVITARGTDLNLIPRHPLPRRWIRWAATRADASVGVSAALVAVLRDLGADPARLHVMRNGIDLERFRPLPKSVCRDELGIASDGPVLLAVGNLVELKGHRLMIEALHGLRDATLVIVGEGPERRSLEKLADSPPLRGRVIIAGARPNEELAKWYSAADVLLLASSREGWPNVLLESLACGTPVVATRVGATPEIVSSLVAGVLIEERSPTAIARGTRSLLDRMPSRSDVRRYAEGFGWESTSRAQLELFRGLVGGA